MRHIAALEYSCFTNYVVVLCVEDLVLPRSDSSPSGVQKRSSISVGTLEVTLDGEMFAQGCISQVVSTLFVPQLFLGFACQTLRKLGGVDRFDATRLPVLRMSRRGL